MLKTVFQGDTSVVVPNCHLFLLSVFILWFTCYVSDILRELNDHLSEKEMFIRLPRVPFVNCCQFMYLVIYLLALRAGYGI